MAGKIFINYRRGDDPGFAQALYQRLKPDFPPGDLLMDVEGHIKPGDDFVAVLNRQVAACDVLLALIGVRWADLMAQRVDAPEDFVAIEIKAALDQGKRVVPVLVGGAAMPRADALPEAIRALVRLHAVGVRHERFEADCQGLVTALKEQLAAAERERAAHAAAERSAANAEREAEEADRIAAAAAARRLARAQGLARTGRQMARWGGAIGLAALVFGGGLLAYLLGVWPWPQGGDVVSREPTKQEVRAKEDEAKRTAVKEEPKRLSSVAEPKSVPSTLAACADTADTKAATRGALTIAQPKLLTVMENLYEHQGVLGHDIVLVFETAFEDAGAYSREEFRFSDGGVECRAQWIDVGQFRRGAEQLFPAGLLERISL